MGIEISGDPRGGDFNTFSELMQTFKEESGLKVALHCAEAEEQMNESQAMIDFNPDRLGHCVYLVRTSTSIINMCCFVIFIDPGGNPISC